MPHITFIHGIANKPSSEKLLENWRHELADGGLDLGVHNVSSSMVYWADVLYPEPEASETVMESVDHGLGMNELDEDMSWVDDLPDSQKQMVESLAGKLGLDKTAPGGDRNAMPSRPMDEEAEFEFEAIPLPWSIKERVMKRLLKDVHHYLFNETFSPRPGESYEVQTHIRKLFVDQLTKDKAEKDGPHVVVSHSMGTVISYDCLKNVPGCPAVDGYLTVGSPLGISEVHDNFDPEHERKDAFPSATVLGNWVNVYDRLDPVAFDARLANDYQKSGTQVITDTRVRNSGRWRHSSYKYYGQEKLCNHLADLLGLSLS